MHEHMTFYIYMLRGITNLFFCVVRYHTDFAVSHALLLPMFMYREHVFLRFAWLAGVTTIS